MFYYYYYYLIALGLNTNTHSAKFVTVDNYQFETKEMAIADTLITPNDSLAQIAIFQNVDMIEVSATRMSEQSPIPNVTVNKQTIAANNTGVDLPYLLEQTPSAVSTSDAGAGIGYTGIRIRGSDATRINVTINGVPINDAESQGVFWVNMPDLATSAEDIQLQRGAGGSTNGAGAFGATVNIRLNKLKPNAFAQTSNSIGSFNSRKNNISFGTGLINGLFSVEARLSKIVSDGYIDRASSNLSAYSITATLLKANTIIRFNLFGGQEQTYQSWGAVPIQYIDTNRTYNPYTYKNEVDNYKQPNYQLHFNHSFGNKLTANFSLHYTRGAGYYEQYKTNQRLNNYGLANMELGDTVISKTDLIRRRWLDNHFYGFVFNSTYQSNNSSFIIGGGANQYKGRHYGEIIWAQYASNSNIGYNYYNNNAIKNDANIYIKYNKLFLNDKLTLFADLQQRYVNYTFEGYDQNLNSVQQIANYLFFNPKLGANYNFNSMQRVYFSFAIANKEPNRNDLTEATFDARPKAEHLQNYELGFQHRNKKYLLIANLYLMNYSNQLVVTGKLNDVGANVRTNVAQSYRAGLELQLGYQLNDRLKWEANATFSQNKILDFVDYVDNWDSGLQDTQFFAKTNIAFSPNWIAASTIDYSIIKNKLIANNKHSLSVALLSKYVGKQYLDNTSSEIRALNAYFFK